jgi:hypothetical protein
VPVQTRRRAAATTLVLVVAAAGVAAAGCGGGDTTATTRAQTGTDAGDTPAPVAVLGSSVGVDPQHMTLSLRLKQPEGVDPPIAKTATVALQGKGINYDGSKQPACGAATIRSRGVDACPKGSIVGTGTALGKADTAQTKAQITIVNGGRNSVLFSTIIRNPAYVKTVVPGKIATSDDGLTITFTFPPDLQNVGGVPVGLQQLTIALNRGGAVTTAECENDWHYDADVTFADHTTARHDGRVTC